MAIRFACPACQQPIEIDEQWSGQSVACPYCQRVVTAPAQSTWPAGQVPMASPAGGLSAPPPPAGAEPVAVRRGGRGRLALALALLSLVLGVVGWFVAIGTPLSARVVQRFGEQATPEQMQQVLEEQRGEWARGNIEVDRRGVLASTLGLICSLAALILAIQSLLRHDRRRVSAIMACIISVLLVACELPIVGLGCMGPQGMPGLTSAPAAQSR